MNRMSGQEALRAHARKRCWRRVARLSRQSSIPGPHALRAQTWPG
jgi:hypothetical protein